MTIEANKRFHIGRWGCAWLVASDPTTGAWSAQLMHTQGTDFKTVEMALEPGLGLLMGASSHLRAGGSAATLHSLRPSPGYLALQGSLALPPPNSPPQANQQGVQVRHR